MGPYPSPPGPRLPGHEKHISNAWIAALITAPGSTPSYNDFPADIPERVPKSPHAFQMKVAWARAASRCPAIRQLIDAADAPLTVSRFVHNLFDSVSNAKLRIPGDPQDAYRKFCGSGTPREVRALTTH
jgi:hypothetical protein